MYIFICVYVYVYVMSTNHNGRRKLREKRKEGGKYEIEEKRERARGTVRTVYVPTSLLTRCSLSISILLALSLLRFSVASSASPPQQRDHVIYRNEANICKLLLSQLYIVL